MRSTYRKFKPREPESGTAKVALQSLLDKMGFQPEKYAIFEIWDQETKNFIKGCKAVAVQGKRLCVEVPSVIHRQELLYIKDRLIKRVNQAMGQKAITDIRFELKGGDCGQTGNRQWNGSFRQRNDR